MSSAGMVHTHIRSNSDTPAVIATPEDLVKTLGGTKAIHKVLIANNGIAAVKFMRSIRRWSLDTFKNSQAITFVVMTSPEELQANAEFISVAEEYVEVPRKDNRYNIYANVELILETVQKMSADAVWVGWGLASEMPQLPELLAKHNISFLGPPGKAIRILEDKIEKIIVVQSVKIPTLPWSGSGLTVDFGAETVPISLYSVPRDLPMKALVGTSEDGLEAAKLIGFPVMIKAAKHVNQIKCESAEAFPALFRQIRAEIPGSRLFVTALAEAARHIEVQVLADKYGNAISLFGRDCSIRLGLDKFIVESPATQDLNDSNYICPPAIFERMEKDAVKLAKLIGYESAGTFEFLFKPNVNEPSGGQYFFHTATHSLQVEHPCTEMVANMNLPAAQLQIAMGIPLHRIREIRLLYGAAPWGSGRINFDDAEKSDVPVIKPQPKGHVIAARITSEVHGIKPSWGTVQELKFGSSPHVWGYSLGVTGGIRDFGHCFSWGENRIEAKNNMVLALNELSIREDFTYRAKFLIGLLEHEDFMQNHFNTAWLDKLFSEEITADVGVTDYVRKRKREAAKKEIEDTTKAIAVHREKIEALFASNPGLEEEMLADANKKLPAVKQEKSED